MSATTFTGSAEITDEGIKKHFKNYDPIRAIYELVWNGLDANAKSVAIQVKNNPLGGIDIISVLDDGDGIDIRNMHENFGKFNESSKRYDDDKHGSHGKGRLAFHQLCDEAVWFTRYGEDNAKIEIKSNSIKEFAGNYLETEDQHSLLEGLDTGTCVELRVFVKSLPEDGVFLDNLAKEFGWFLALNNSINITLNGTNVKVPNHDMHDKIFEIEGYNFNARIIRWHDKPSSEKSFNYITNQKCKAVRKEHSKFNNKISFYTSAYVSSDWAESYDPHLLELDEEKIKQEGIYKKVMRNLLTFQKEIYKDFLRSYVDEEIKKYDRNGYFPNYSGLETSYAEWRKNNTKDVLRKFYIADPTIFNKLNAKQAKVLIRLLDIVLVSNENDALLDVLDGVLDLDDDNIGLLAKQLKKTTLKNIVSTIETLQKRQIAVHKIQELIENRHKEILETPDLQKIIENNTWLFGPQYTILGAEEDSFTKIAKNLRNSVKDIDIILDDDIEDGINLDGAKKQVDLFLARKVPSYNSANEQIFKCVIIEIKRPSVSLNKKHLQQIEEYAEIIAKHPGFSSDKMTFELILIGRKISKDDYQINRRREDLKGSGEYGLVMDGRIKCYVKDWFTIFDEFKLSNGYLLENLNTKLEDFSKGETSEMVQELQRQTA